MVFNPNARLNPRQVLDRRGVGGAGGIALGGGGIGVVLLLAYLLLGGDPSVLSGGGNPGFVTDQNGTQLTQECQTGADANSAQDCRIVGFVNSIQQYWSDEFARRGQTYDRRTVLFTARRRRPAAAASAASGRSTARRPHGLHRPGLLRRAAARASAPRAARSPRRTSWPTSTATTSRT